jgi:hypothetical protein
MLEVAVINHLYRISMLKHGVMKNARSKQKIALFIARKFARLETQRGSQWLTAVYSLAGAQSVR